MGFIGNKNYIIMKTKNIILGALLMSLLNIPLSGFGQQRGYREDSLLVRKAFEYLNEDKTNELISIVNNSHKDYQTMKKTLGGHIHAIDISVYVDPAYTNQVFFSCTIPGGATATIFNIVDQNFNISESESISKNIPLKGSIKILTNPKTGKKLIDISEEKDPFSLCLNIAYNGLMEESIKPGDLNTDEGFSNTVKNVTLVVGNAYNSIVDEKYFSDVFMPDLKKILEVIMQARSLNKNNTATNDTKRLQQENITGQTDAIKNININYRIIIYITGIVIFIIIVGVIWFANIKKNKKKKALQKIREGVPSAKQVKSFTSPDQTFVKSKLKEQIKDFSIESNSFKQGQIVFGDYSPDKITSSDTTRTGWSIAALGKLITQDCTPEKFKASIEDFEKKIIPKYNNDLSAYESKRQELMTIQENKDKSNELSQYDIRNKYSLFQTLNERLEKGILAYADEEGILPFAFFMQVINDNQSRFDRFVRQGAIMGMIDFFMKYRNDEIIKPYFESLIAARANMINSDNYMSFFEVRAPLECTVKQYAAILKEVLHCANPTVQYCDTEKLMKIAEKEIPGIMDLLINFPLRLIDPGNTSTEGFYNFEPLRHAMWVNYTPPLNVGQVNRRYHEILDMTLPNSSGLNIRLFTDPYAAIPVMFHEYNHYMEDPNEASVFLKSYAFSLKFYRKYKQANPEKDFAFVALKGMLGKSINPKYFQELNNLILRYYGMPKSKEEAVYAAEDFLQQKNLFIDYSNEQEKWCPEIKMPKLNDKEDKQNADIIKGIIIRFAQVPRTITKEEFKRKRKSFYPLKSSTYNKYKTKVYDMLLSVRNVKENNKEIKWYESWKSFKDWCIEKQYIKKYN